MTLIPQNRQWNQNNQTDIGGAIVASRNIDLTTPGYLALEDRSVSIKTSEGDSNFGILTGMETFNSANRYYLTTSQKPYTVVMDPITVTEDVSAGNPGGSLYSGSVVWQSRYYAAVNTAFYYHNGTSWSSVTLSPTLTTSELHPVCIFENRQTLVIGNGNQVKQINTSHVDTINLSLPTEYKVSRIVYNNNRVGITTYSTRTDTDSFFFVWDGASAEASGYSIKSPQALGIVAYKSSFLVLNSRGQLLYFNGSGFDILDTFPIGIVHEDENNNKMSSGNIHMVVRDNDFVDLTVQTSETLKDNPRQEYYSPNSPAGIYTWSKETGLYHGRSISMSVMFKRTIDTTAVDTSTDIITTTSVPITGTPVYYFNTNASIIGGLKHKTVYYVIKLSSTTLKLALTKTNALAGTAIDLTSTGFSLQLLVFYPEKDFGQSFIDGRMTPILRHPNLGSYSDTSGRVFFGNENGLTNTLSSYKTLCTSMGLIENRGWFITSKVLTENIKDMFNKLVIKFKPLKLDVDKIIVKYRVSDFESINQLSVYNLYCTWTAANTFTTTDNLSTILVGHEIEVVAGAGAGQIAHVSSISESSGTYTVVLDESLIEVSAADKCYISANNWLKLKTITTSTATNNDGYADVAIGKNSKWIQFKIEMRGVDIKIEDLNVVPTTHIPLN